MGVCAINQAGAEQNCSELTSGIENELKIIELRILKKPSKQDI